MHNMVLNTLAAEINLLHDAANEAAASAVQYAAKCGAKLNEAKASLPHGEFTGWVEANCRVTPQQSRKYMKLAAEMPQLIDSKGKTSFLLGLDAAIAYLSASEEVKEKVDRSPEPVGHRTIKTWEAEYKASQKKIEQLSIELDSRPVIEREVVPADYEPMKKAMVELQKEKADLQQKSDNAKRLANEARIQVESIERQKKKAIKEGVESELKKIDDQLKRAEAQESIYKRRSEEAKKEYESIAAKAGAAHRRANAGEKVRHSLVVISAELYDVVDDGYELNDDEIKLWSDVAKQMAGASELINNWLEGR